MAIQAIQTRYAGCHFRSRLEARWSVFFDRLKIKWRYEPEGFVVGPPERRRPYLPDFWLPGLGLWVEVKGDRSSTDFTLLVDAVNGNHGLPGGKNGYRLLLLGDVPRVDEGWACSHQLLGFHKGDYLQTAGSFRENGGLDQVADNWVIHNDGWEPGELQAYIERSPSLWRFDAHVESNAGYLAVCADLSPPAPWRAYTAARSARFEHGQSGAT